MRLASQTTNVHKICLEVIVYDLILSGNMVQILTMKCTEMERK